MTLTDWARKHNVSDAALRELADTATYSPPVYQNMSEAGVQSRVRLEAAQTPGLHLWRNNVGAGKLENGQFVRFGLANDSPKLNEILKSADLIGIRRVHITQNHVGSIIGQFVSREIKRSDWKFSNTPEEKAQLRWAALIESYGGDSKLTTGTGSL